MGRRPVAGGGGRYVDRRAAEHRSPPVSSADGTIRVVEGDESHRQQAGVVLAEVGDGEVVGRAAGVQEIQVLAHEHRRGEGGEHELSVEAEHVDHVAALGRVERAHRAPALVDAGAAPRPRCAPRHRCRRSAASAVALSSTGARRRHLAGPQPVDASSSMNAIEEAGQLHQVAVGVEHSTAPCVRHCGVRRTGVGHIRLRSVSRRGDTLQPRRSSATYRTW